MSHTPHTALNLVRLGANLRIESSQFTPHTLVELAGAAKESGSHLTIGGHHTPHTLAQIASIGGRNVTFLI
jgi:hypothetical protein